MINIRNYKISSIGKNRHSGLETDPFICYNISGLIIDLYSYRGNRLERCNNSPYIKSDQENYNCSKSPPNSGVRYMKIIRKLFRC